MRLFGIRKKASLGSGYRRDDSADASLNRRNRKSRNQHKTQSDAQADSTDTECSALDVDITFSTAVSTSFEEVCDVEVSPHNSSAPPPPVRVNMGSLLDEEDDDYVKNEDVIPPSTLLSATPRGGQDVALSFEAGDRGVLEPAESKSLLDRETIRIDDNDLEGDLKKADKLYKEGRKTRRTLADWDEQDWESFEVSTLADENVMSEAEEYDMIKESCIHCVVPSTAVLSTTVCAAAAAMALL